MIRTVNHQLISAAGMTQAQQAQWNQIRQQQVIVVFYIVYHNDFANETFFSSKKNI